MMESRILQRDWHKDLSRWLLAIPGLIYGGVVGIRWWAYRHRLRPSRRLPGVVISVGNLTVGGTGKTPCVAWIARYLAASGREVAILSRGYRRRSVGLVEVSDGASILAGAAEAGDEPWILARACPGVRVVVDKRRHDAGRWLLERAKVGVFLLDDGYQHLGLARDLDLLLVDATESPAEWRMAPAGRLREPLRGMSRADVVVVTRSDRPFDRALLEERLRRYLRPETPIIYAWHELTSLHTIAGERVADPAAMAGRRVAAMAGIARPGIFFEDLRRLGMSVVLTRSFADHHHYTWPELESVVEDARAAGAEALLITEKDAANLPDSMPDFPILVARLDFRCGDEERLRSILDNAVDRRSS